MSTISKFAPDVPVCVHDVAGVRQATACCGIKCRDKPDLLLVELASGTQVAGVFTRSETAAAPVDWCRRILDRGQARGLVVNSGNANAFTGVSGLQIVEQEAVAAALALGTEVDDIFVASTGVIGEVLPVDRIVGQIPRLKPELATDRWHEAATSIMTTDTFPKVATRKATIGDTQVTISGYAKGAGMIMPDMATMLCFVYTDAKLTADVLQPMLNDSMDRSFHSITVDGDTSTNDTVLLFATGQAEHPQIATADSPLVRDFRVVLSDCLHELAMHVVGDAEGITKLAQINVSGARSDDAARRIVTSIANSPLVKTAIAGADANWGRVVMAVGKAYAGVDKSKIGVAFGPHQLAINGNPIPLPSTEDVDRYMKNDRIEINVSVGDGSGARTMWTSDLSHDYVSINADYRS